MHERDVSPLEKPYDAKEHEARLYKRWEDSGYFNPDNLPSRHTTPYSIVLPPPNVTGTLHCGHATMLAIQDTIVRFKRMQGFKTLWLPGTDHAAIATQSKVEKEISKKEGKSRYDLGREELLRRIGIFAQESHDTIVGQCKSMGSSLDWSREAFTLDEKRNKAVYKAFKEMYDLGLIYRGQRVINWDPKGQTTISDDEIVYEEREATLYTFKYSTDFPIAISTTRPETKFGDTAVAVHPDDERYVNFIGKTIETSFCGVTLSIRIIADRNVEKDFGTGALGVTPAHSKVDEEMARANDLPFVQVIDEKGRMTVGGENVVGKKTAEARELVAQKLRDAGLMIEEKKITQNVSTAERTGAIIEPLPKLQWFVAVNKEFGFPHKEKTIAKAGELVTLKTLMHRAVESNATTILPDRFAKVYEHWINNLRDWCISRQIWYGHRIPVWYKGDEVYCGLEAPTDTGWTQDEDTLDTWFSSGTWSFSTLGWPNETNDLKTYHPNDLLETGRDIIFFWVARMILMSTCLLGEVPFKTVYLHGMALNKDGKKMSKSSGDTVDPLVVIEKYGTDALRMALIVGNAPGNDFKLYDEKIKAYKHFANKIWNASRFVLTNTQGVEIDESKITQQHKNILIQSREVIIDVTKDIEKYNLYIAAEKLYSFFWHSFADIYIESVKPLFQSEDKEGKESAQVLMRIILEEQLKALHPFMPFVTEAVWEIMYGKDKENLLLIQSWPTHF
jgi:valyl-tRNA synthetase